jgi:hypothetical protein
MPTLGAILGVLVAIGFVGVLLQRGRASAPYSIEGPRVMLRHSPLLRWFSILAVFGGNSAMAMILLLTPPKDPNIALAMTAGIAVLSVCGLALLWESFQWMLSFTPERLECRSPWGKRIDAAWSEVDSVTYSSVQSWHVVRFKSGATFRVPAIVPGVGMFLEMVKQQNGTQSG